MKARRKRDLLVQNSKSYQSSLMSNLISFDNSYYLVAINPVFDEFSFGMKFIFLT